MAADVGIETEQIDYGLGAMFSDVDRDGDLDLYVANDTHPNRLYVTTLDPDSPLGFTLAEQGALAGVDDENAGMGVASGRLRRGRSARPGGDQHGPPGPRRLPQHRR